MQQTLPVFVYPTSLQFYADDSNSHKQLATIFNPYEFTIKFKVLSTAPKKYTVGEPEGFIKSKCCIDLIIKHNSLGFLNENVTDKLRIQIFQIISAPSISNANLTSSQLYTIGKKDIPIYSIVSRESYSNLINKLNHESGLNLNESSMGDLNPYYGGNNLNLMMQQGANSPAANNFKSRPTENNNSNSNVYPNAENVSYLVMCVGMVCLCLMFLPLVGSAGSRLPDYLHITLEIKLFASFVLGMVTMVILKS